MGRGAASIQPDADQPEPDPPGNHDVLCFDNYDDDNNNNNNNSLDLTACYPSFTLLQERLVISCDSTLLRRCLLWKATCPAPATAPIKVKDLARVDNNNNNNQVRVDISPLRAQRGRGR